MKETTHHNIKQYFTDWCENIGDQEITLLRQEGDDLVLLGVRKPTKHSLSKLKIVASFWIRFARRPIGTNGCEVN